MKKQFEEFLGNRISDYPDNANVGPGEQNDPITQITCGYEVGDPGWIAIVIDTRPVPAIDGEWTLHIEGNEISVNRWGVSLSKSDVEAKVGEKLQSYLQAAFKSDQFASLPIDDDCLLTVEENNGAWGWGSHADDSNEAYVARLTKGAQGLTGAKAVDYWIGILDESANGKFVDDEWGFLVNDLAFESLLGLDESVAIPLLKFVEKWSDKEELDGDLPATDIKHFPMQSPVMKVLQLMPEIGKKSPEVLNILRTILKRSVEVNSTREVWGMIPRWTAHALNKLSRDSPRPKIDAHTNKLTNASEYL